MKTPLEQQYLTAVAFLCKMRDQNTNDDRTALIMLDNRAQLRKAAHDHINLRGTEREFHQDPRKAENGLDLCLKHWETHSAQHWRETHSL